MSMTTPSRVMSDLRISCTSPVVRMPGGRDYPGPVLGWAAGSSDSSGPGPPVARRGPGGRCQVGPRVIASRLQGYQAESERQGQVPCVTLKDAGRSPGRPTVDPSVTRPVDLVATSARSARPTRSGRVARRHHRGLCLGWTGRDRVRGR